jgi:hypothetical protein
MPEISVEELGKLEQNLHELVRIRSFELMQSKNPPLPQLAALLTKPLGTKEWFLIPAMFGGFQYWLVMRANKPVLMVESWCRVLDTAEARYEITAEGITPVF